MVNNKSETPINNESDKFHEAATKAYETIINKPRIQEVSDRLFEKASESMSARRNLIIEAYSIAAELTQVLPKYLDRNDLSVLHNWSNLGIDLGHPEVSVETALQKEIEAKLDITDIASEIDVLTPLLDSQDVKSAEIINPETFSETAEAFNTFIKETLEVIFKASDNPASESNKDVYKAGLGIERLMMLTIATGKLAEFTKDQKIIELDKLSKTEKVESTDTTVEDLLQGKIKGNGPVGF